MEFIILAVILFSLGCALVVGNFMKDDKEIPCTLHDWSLDITNDELVCMTCSFRARNPNNDHE